MRAKGILALALALSLAGAVEAEAPASVPAAKKAADAKPADLKDAQARLAAASAPAEYAAMLDAFSTSLQPQDALALLDQGMAGAAPEYRKALTVKAADLDLLLGLFGDAAARYETAAGLGRYESADGLSPGGGKDAALLLRSARCFIAAGDAERAQASAASLLMSSSDPELSTAARLVGAWALVMLERPEDAAALASAIAGAAKGGAGYPSGERRREARFILWLCAAPPAKAQAAAALASEFPGSPEALIASGAASAPPLPHWYLGGLGAARRAASAPGTPSAAPATAAPAPTVSAPGTPAPAPTTAAPPAPASTAAAPASAAPASATASAPAAAAKGKRLQVGYFSREDNAQALKAELSSKGFAASIEVRIRSAAPGKAEEKRWIVAVDPGKDIATSLQRLKDAGYESYVIE